MATRLIQGIKDFYPNCEISAYIDSESNETQKTVIDYIFNGFYKNTYTIKNKKYKEFYIDSEYGTENLKGMIENVPAEIYEEMTQKYDLFYDYQIDKLDWIDYPFDWLKYFNKFPEITIRPQNKWGNFIVGHLISSSNFEHCLDKDFYIQRLVKDLDKYCAEKQLKLYLITTDEYFDFYVKIAADCYNVEIFRGNVKQVCDLIINSKGMISTDSGFRYIANCMNIPVITFTRNCYGPFQPFESHHVRWLVNKDEIFPLNWNTKDVIDVFSRKMENRIYRLLPHLTNWQKQLIKRNYKVNLEKSILK